MNMYAFVIPVYRTVLVSTPRNLQDVSGTCTFSFCLQVPWLEHENNDYSSMERSLSRGGGGAEDDAAATDVDEFGTQRTTSLLTTSYSRHAAVQQSATNPNVVFRRPVDLMY